MISSKVIENAVYDLCVEANTALDKNSFKKILSAYNSEKNPNAKQALQLILINAQMAYEKKMPLCQDTGQVLIFAKIGEKCQLEDFEKSVNCGVKRAYEENFYRKSVVKNSLFERINTKTNTPCIIYTEFIEGKDIELNILVKGAGSENVSEISMLSPTATENEIIDFITSVVKQAGAKACPPYFIGVGIGGTVEYAGLLSKKALLLEKNIDNRHEFLAERIKSAVNDLNIGAAGFGATSTALDVKILTDFTHIACMPTAVTINCHSVRHSECTISKGGSVIKESNKDFLTSPAFNQIDFSDFIKIHSSETTKLKSLEKGQKILLSGEIYTARDMAHKRLAGMIKNNEKLPFDLKNSIIFYAGPCPCKENCVVGSIGPTTSSRMDKFALTLYEKGVLATIGKGERSKELEKTVKQIGGLYFTVIGGISCYLSEKFIKKELVAFDDLGPEAVYKFEVKDFPLKLEF